MNSKKYFYSCLLLLTVWLQGQSQNKWLLKDSILILPNNFPDWIVRNVGAFKPYNQTFGSIIGTNQSKQYFDFNRDGKKDICFELMLGGFMGDKFDSAYRYWKGIFINNGKNKYILDTNFIITGRGSPWYGKFGDFNGDGLVDYFHMNQNYHGDQSKKPLDLFKYQRSDVNPSHVFLNNGKSFNIMDLDTAFMMSTNGAIYDINNDGADEIISMPSERFIIYQYNKQSKSFDSKFQNINDSITKWYGRTIKWFHFENIVDNKIITTISYNSFSPNKQDWNIDLVQIDLKDSSLKIINRFQHPIYITNDNYLSNATFHANESFKYFDLNNDGSNELIMISPFNFNNNERMGFNVIENNSLQTKKYWDYDTSEVGFRIQGYIKDIDGDKLPDIIASEWNLDKSKKYFSYYYKYNKSKFIKTQIEYSNKNFTPLNIPYWNWVEDLNDDGINDILFFNVGNIYEHYLLESVICDKIISKPIFNSNKYSFCSGDSLKLSITNVNKGDTLKWYFGSKSDITNVANKTFTDSSKVFVTRTDSLGCMISSDTIQLKKYAIPSSPSLIRDTLNNIVASTNGITWYKDGVKITDTTQKIKPTTNGIYTATTTQNGCTSTLSQGYYYLTNAVANLSNEEYFKISPNPTSGELNINYKISSSKNINISVFDINGRAVLLNKKVESGSKVNLGPISNGNYIIQVKDGSGRLIASQKLVKE